MLKLAVKEGSNLIIYLRLEISYLLIYIIHAYVLGTRNLNSQALARDLSIIEAAL